MGTQQPLGATFPVAGPTVASGWAGSRCPTWGLASLSEQPWAFPVLQPQLLPVLQPCTLPLFPAAQERKLPLFARLQDFPCLFLLSAAGWGRDTAAELGPRAGAAAGGTLRADPHRLLLRASVSPAGSSGGGPCGPPAPPWAGRGQHRVLGWAESRRFRGSSS